VERLYSDGQGPIQGCCALEEDGGKGDDDYHNYWPHIYLIIDSSDSSKYFTMTHKH